jgi:hypothetical protein
MSTHITPTEAVDIIRDCQERMLEALGELEQVARSLDDAHADAYIIAHLKTLLSSQHGYLDSSYNLDDWMEEIENQESDDQEQ